MVANGIDYNDLSRLEDRIDGWADWCGEFAAVGDDHAALGEAALARDDERAAGRHFVQAAMYYHFGSHVWHVDAEERDAAHRRAVDLFARGGQYLDPPVQRVEAPFEDIVVPGNLRVPEAGPDGSPGDSPLVVLLPGLDSIKEELTTYDDVFHDRGVATLAVDGAAQGETWYERGMTPDYPDLISAVVDHLRDLDPEGVDVSRLGVYGVSLGGFYAPYVAAHEDRFDACVGISGPFTVGPVSSRGSPLLREQFQWACKADSMVEVDETTDAMSMRDCIHDLTAPSLMVTGAHDTIIPPAQTRRIADRAPDGEFLLYDDGNHVCNDIPYKYKPRSAAWLRDRLVEA
jgi:2,6-dihydroxypseudooxynicotine hydrolase